MSAEPYDPIESIAEALWRIVDVLEEWAKVRPVLVPPETVPDAPVTRLRWFGPVDDTTAPVRDAEEVPT